MRKIIVVMICTLFALSLAGCAGKEKTGYLADQAEDATGAKDDSAVVGGDVCPAVMVDGVVYYDTGCKSDAIKRCGVMDGEITEKCDSSEIPAKNNQSNFGTGYGYQYGSAEGTIEVRMGDGEWYIFAAEGSQNTEVYGSKGK